MGPCAKQTVTATVVALDGTRYVATNHVDQPQKTCPRGDASTGQRYDLCSSVCHQPAHAEVNAIRLAGTAAKGSRLLVEGHTYVCRSCKEAADLAGVSEIVIVHKVHK